MTSWRWADPMYLSWLLLIPLIYALATLVGRRKMIKLRAAFGEKMLPFLTSGFSFRKHQIKLILCILSLVPLILALMRPQFGETKENIKSLGVEMILLFDVSQSMLAEDVSPSRLEFAKHEIMRLVDLIPGSKMGLVAFAGSAALISPITTDSSALKMFIESLTTEAISTQGTEFKMALEQAEDAFARGGQGDDPQSKVTRVILVVSDGEDQEPGTLELAEKLANQGIRIFSISVGTEKGGSIPLRDSNGFLRGYKKDSSGQVINTTSNGVVLKSLAQAGKGSFYTAAFGGSYMNQLVEDINKLEQTEFDSQTIVNFQERYQVFLLAGLLMLLVELLISVYQRPGADWKGRFQVKS